MHRAFPAKVSRAQWEELLFSPEREARQQEQKDLAKIIATQMVQAELTPRQREILLLYYKEKRTMPEIARLLGVTVSSVSRTHRRACQHIKDRLAIYYR
jgi:RNA polymerase sigma factor (sigma-70 family)